MKGYLIAAGVIMALLVARVHTMEASTKFATVNTCNGPVAIPLAASNCCGRDGLFAGVTRRMEARQEGRQAKRHTKQAVRSTLRSSCAIPVSAPVLAYQAVPVTEYRMMPVTTYQAVPFTTIQYRATPLMSPAPCKTGCEEQPVNPGPSPADQDPPLSAPRDGRDFTAPPRGYRS